MKGGFLGFFSPSLAKTKVTKSVVEAGIRVAVNKLGNSEGHTISSGD